MIPGTCVRTGDGAVQGEGKGFFVFIVVCDVVALIRRKNLGLSPAPTSTHQTHQHQHQHQQRSRRNRPKMISEALPLASVVALLAGAASWACWRMFGSTAPAALPAKPPEHVATEPEENQQLEQKP